MRTRDYLRELFMVLFIRQGIIVGMTLAALPAGALIALAWPRVYQAEGALILKGGQILAPPGRPGDVQGEVTEQRESDLYSEMEILRSQRVTTDAVRALARRGEIELSPDDDSAIDALGAQVKRRLRTTLVARSNVIRGTLSWGDPARAQALLQGVFDEYLRRRQAVFHPEEAQRFFAEQVDALREDLAALEERMLERTGGAGVTQLTDEIQRNIELETRLRAELNDLETRRVRQAHYVDYLEQSLEDGEINLFTSIENLQLGEFAQKVQDLMIRKESLLQDYRPDSTRVRRTQQALDRIYAIFRSEARRFLEHERTTLASIRKQIDSVRGRLDAIEAENRRLYQDLVTAQRLDRERAVGEDSYQAFARRLRDSRIRNESRSDRLFRVGIVEPPHAPPAPVFPRTGRLLPISAIAGLLVGLALGLIAELFDHRFKRPEDIERRTGLPYLFSVPRSSGWR